MKKIKVIFAQTMMVSFMVLCAISLYGFCVMRAENWSFDWFIPGSIVLASLVSSILTVFLLHDESGSRSRVSEIIRTILHFLLLYLIIMAFGYLCYWYKSPDGAVLVSVIYVVVYIGVWAGTVIMFRHDEKVITDALESVRDEE